MSMNTNRAKAMMVTGLRLACLLCAVVALGGCGRMYYGTMEKLGYEKRDIMVKRVAKARDSQEDAKEQFKDALEQFRSVVDFKGGDLETEYNRLSAALEKSQARADTVRSRIADVEKVAADLFDEWEDELDEYSNATLRRDSEKKLRQTQARYKELIGAMHRAEARLEPVLRPMRDQVLYLKHNLNAQAIGALQGELENVEQEVASLIREMETAIGQADQFIASIRQN